MSEKVKITLEVDPTQTTIIQPLGEKMAERAKIVAGNTALDEATTHGTTYETSTPLPDGGFDTGVDF